MKSSMPQHWLPWPLILGIDLLGDVIVYHILVESSVCNAFSCEAVPSIGIFMNGTDLFFTLHSVQCFMGLRVSLRLISCCYLIEVLRNIFPHLV